ncbi:MAG: 16S rRNA (cytidine(1402)-2'-O)-methyltransferase [Hyphomicrobium sp.]
MSQQTADDDEDGAADLPSETLPRRVADEAARQLAEDLPPALYLVATPIGNLGDITLRALSVLARADVIYCEDTRHSARLLRHYAIRTQTRPLHEHNEDQIREGVLAELEKGRRVALISDAGTPLISDPGYKLVRDATARGHRVTGLPGPSSVITALAASGLPTNQFLFAGFLPPKHAARLTRLAELKLVPATLVFFEAPQRLSDTLADMATVFGARRAVVARELTKMFEEMASGTLSELADAMAAREVKGEIVVVVGPPVNADVDDGVLIERLREVLETVTLKEAAKSIATEFNVQKSRVYNLGVKLKEGET